MYYIYLTLACARSVSIHLWWQQERPVAAHKPHQVAVSQGFDMTPHSR
jgi:hypothetical protein